MPQVFADPPVAVAFILVLFLFLFCLSFVNRAKKEPKEPDSIWYEFKQK